MAIDLNADIAAVQGIAAVPRILEVVCRSTGMGFAAVARVTEQRWICCAVRDEIAFGLAPGGELQVETTICHEIRQSGEAVVIDSVADDLVFCGHHTPAQYGFQSYISMPIILADGSFFGTLCAIDRRPARLNTPQTIGMFKLFAELIATHLDAANRLALSEARLLGERETSELREQFIAVLGHDLRNPLASIAAGTNLLTRGKRDAAPILALMQQSVARMSALIDNVLDFARGRLGGGIALNRKPQPLEPVLEQVIAELRASFPASVKARLASLQPYLMSAFNLWRSTVAKEDAWLLLVEPQRICLALVAGGKWSNVQGSNGEFPDPEDWALLLDRQQLRTEAAPASRTVLVHAPDSRKNVFIETGGWKFLGLAPPPIDGFLPLEDRPLAMAVTAQ